MRKANLANQTFGKLTVVKELGKDRSRNILWLCECVCGATRVARSTQLIRYDVMACRACSRARGSTKDLQMFTIRMSAEDASRVREAARLSGKSINVYCRDLLLGEAKGAV